MADAGLLDWLGAPREDRGLRFLRDDGAWELTSQAELATSARRVAGALLDAGLERGDVVAVVLPTGIDFAAALMGIWIAGGTPAPAVPPALFLRPAGYGEHLARLLSVASVLAVADARALAEVAEAGRGRLRRPPLVVDRTAGEEASVRPRADVALLQFTSGSSGSPRGVRVGWDNLEANVAIGREALGWHDGDAVAHWLPLYHDLGLVGGLIIPTVTSTDAWILRPDQFLMNPARWLACLGDGRATITAAPGFGFAYAARRTPREALDGLDFSGWRIAMVAAERVDPAALEKFAVLLEPHGFRRGTFLPAYGLAEATLSVTVDAIGQAPHALRLDWSAVRFGTPAPVQGRARLGEREIGDGAGWVVSCGRPFPRVEVTVADADGAALPPSHVGEIVVRGPNVARGYAGAPSETTRFEGSTLRTGDVGFVVDGELFVLGRMGDGLAIRGRNHYAEDLESKLTAIAGVPKGRCVVLPGLGDGAPGAIVIVEAEGGSWVEPAVARLRRELGAETAVTVYSAAPGTIPRTSSGKTCRRVLWRALLAGEVEAEVVHAAAAADPLRAPAREMAADADRGGRV